ncbi:MAG: VWA domain-containing protein [Bacillota bacterium]
MALLPPEGDALLRAFLHDPRPGLLLTGDPLLRERILRQLVHALRQRWPVLWLPRSADLADLAGRPDPLAALQGGRLHPPGLLERAREGVLVIPAADLLDGAVAAVACRAERILAAAPDAGDLHPALRERLTAILPLVRAPGALPALLAGEEPEVPWPVPAQAPPPDPASLVAAFDRWGVSGHRLECQAALLAGAVAATGGSPAEALERFVLAPRSSQPPPPPPPPHQEAAAKGETAGPAGDEEHPPEPPAPVPPQALPEPPGRSRARHPAEGRRGPLAPDRLRGRRCRVGPGLRKGSLALLATIQSAAPWQVRRGSAPGGRVQIRPEDLRWALRRRHAGRLTILVVDGSGSMARRAIRLAKGIALDLLQQAYRNRNRVAIVLVRGTAATVALWPTRSTARARQCLRALPTGGATPLASGLLLAARLAAQTEPASAAAILLTDGRANLGVGGDPYDDALRALHLLRERTAGVEVVDLSPRHGTGRGAAWLA